MNIYWAGGEDIDFALVGTAVGATGGPFDTAFVRSNLAMSSSNAAWPPSSSASNPVSFGNLSSFWLHCGFNSSSSGTGQILNTIPFAFADAAGVGRLLIRNTGNVGQFKISTRNAAGTITDLVTGTNAAFVQAALVKIDIFVNYSTSGRVQVYANGAVIADTGAGVNVTTDSATSLSFFYLGPCQTNVATNAYSEVIVADSDTRSLRLWLLNSATAGNAQTWSGAAANVNKTLINDSTFISAATAGLIEEFKTGGILLPQGTYLVPAVVMTSRALGGSAGAPTKVEYVTRVGSTDYVGGTWTPPVGSFANDTQNYKQATNPGTSAAWTTADLTASTFNYGIESVT